MRTKKIVLISLACAAIAAITYGYREYTRGAGDLLYVKEDYYTEVNKFVKEFEANEKIANDKYLDKIVAVDGVVKEVLKDDKGFYTVILGGRDYSSSVRCSISPEHQNKVNALLMGNGVTIKGVCTGFNADELLGSDVILNRCVIAECN